MVLLSATQAQELDRLAIAELGIPEAALMEAAGFNLALAMEREWGALSGRRVALLCGKGNNGADGMVLARHLLNMGASPVLCVAAAKEELKGAARLQDQVLSSLGLKNFYVTDAKALPLAKALFDGSDLAVDALCGTGFKGALTGLQAQLMVALNAAGKPVLSVDLPSGLDPDSGQVRGACAYAALTVTFSAPKRGLLQEPGRSYVGKLVSADIGIPGALLSRLGPLAFAPEAAALRALLPSRAPQAHKKSAGSLLLVAGSAQYPGAAILSARAAFRSGAGFVRLLAPREIVGLLQAAVPEAVVSEAAPKAALELASACHAAVVGPGLGRGEAALKLARELYEGLALPALFDADGLFALSKAAKPGGPRLLTPHTGEWMRLAGATEEPADRYLAAQGLSAEMGAALLLKGPGTLLASPDGRLGVNLSGGAALATAGSGDVLAGLCGALMAQGLPPFEAGLLGAHLHGAAGELWCGAHGSSGLTASDLAESLPASFSTLRGKA